MIILLLLRRMSPRARHITGWILLLLGVVVAAISPVIQDNLYLHAAVLAACGIIFLKANPQTRGSRRSAGASADATQEVSRVA
jgi:hypothetical protein